MSQVANEKHNDPDSFTHTFTLCIVIACISKVPIASKPGGLEVFWCVKALDFIYE